MSTAPSRPLDEFAAALARFACEAGHTVSDTTAHAAKRVLLDSFAVSLGALRHPAAAAAQRYAALFPLEGGCRVWGTSVTTSPEAAAFANGVPLRGYDFNDLFSGRAGGGHPSDIIPPLVAAAEFQRAPAERLLRGIAIGYEITVGLMDVIPVRAAQGDYTNLTALGAVCGVASMLEFDIDTTMEALCIVATAHLASNELGSTALNSRGALTMWRRANGAHAGRVALNASYLASVGVEGVYRAFMGPSGWLQRFGDPDELLHGLADSLADGAALRRVGSTTLKRWPVGSRAQSAVQAALDAAAQLDGKRADSVLIEADADAYHHLVTNNPDAYRPHSRESADHSLPYIVAAAVIDGELTSQSFDDAVIGDRERQRFVAECVTVQAVEPRRPERGYPARVSITADDGSIVVGSGGPPPGHPLNPLSDAQLEQKLAEATASLLTPAEAAHLAAVLWDAEHYTVRDIVDVLTSTPLAT